VDSRWRLRTGVAQAHNRLHEIWTCHIQGGSGVQVTKSSLTATTPQNQPVRAAGSMSTTIR
jgi:hypothetical protein